MGQAKRRGSFEKRRMEAIAKKKAIQFQHLETEETLKSLSLHQIKMRAFIATLIGAWGSRPEILGRDLFSKPKSHYKTK